MWIFALYLTLSLASNTWKKTNPTPTAGQIVNLAYGNGLFVAPAWYPNKIEIAISKTGESWQLADIDDSYRLPLGNAFFYVAAYGDTLGWLAVGTTYYGDAGQPPPSYLTSQDGISWTWINNTQKLFFGTSFAFGNGVYVQAGGVNQIFSTVDGHRWNVFNPADLTQGVAFSNGVFYVPMYGEKGYVLKSVDGVNWQVWNLTMALKGEYVREVEWILQGGDGTFLALLSFQNLTMVVGRSADLGETWDVAISWPLYCTFGYLANAGDSYYASGFLQGTSGPTNMFSSDSGKTWVNTSANVAVQALGGIWIGTGQTPGVIQYSLRDQKWVTYNNGIVSTIDTLFYSKSLGSFAICSQQGVYLSQDGTTWQQVNSQSVLLAHYVEDLNVFAGVSGEYLVVSPDLRSWKNVSQLPTGHYGTTWTGLVFVGGVWFVSATVNQGFYTTGTVYQSANGSSKWTKASLPNVAEVSSIVWANGTFVGTATGGYILSTNGSVWQRGQAASFTGCKLSFLGNKANSQFFTVCFYGGVFVSKTGEDFRRIPGLPTVAGVSYLEDRGTFLATGVEGEVYTSQDGESYSLSSTIDSPSPFNLAASGNGFVVAVSTLDNSVFVSQ